MEGSDVGEGSDVSGGLYDKWQRRGRTQTPSLGRVGGLVGVGCDARAHVVGGRRRPRGQSRNGGHLLFVIRAHRGRGPHEHCGGGSARRWASQLTCLALIVIS